MGNEDLKWPAFTSLSSMNKTTLANIRDLLTLHMSATLIDFPQYPPDEVLFIKLKSVGKLKASKNGRYQLKSKKPIIRILIKR